MSQEVLRIVSSRFRQLVSAGCLWIVLIVPGSSLAQTGHHFLLNARMPPGEVARTLLARRPDLAGVSQPVRLKIPETASLAIAEGAGFSVEEQGGALVSLHVGATYRLRVSNIPLEFGQVYPTVELIDRLHAPAGKETRYPIPIEITRQDLRLALAGQFVMRVIYVEDPRRALPVRDLPEQRYIDALQHEDPLHVADRIGRPVAILRMGSLAPGPTGPSASFLFGSPPFTRHAMTPPAPYVPSEHPQDERPAVALPDSKSESVDSNTEVPVDPGEAPVPPEADSEAAPSPNDSSSEEEDPFDIPATEDDADLFDEPAAPLPDDDPFAGDI